ncbi:unnamed protein product [Bursaphelenchus xylophilus]|uniref:Glycosyltransferase family 92 protein n=1 Tax=Bursaphelenchus xylophilus TaxID=6326 RepID=A0A7I8XPD6_BURXY|nr:unnamed protein product [Bursaphelenchus xylophilus]CAG9126831.1 unnamed protein product [Bursaphelenchus xylophilus]
MTIANGGFTFWTVRVSQPAKTKHNVVVCFNQANLLENWQLAMHVVEMYRNLGADLLVLPVLNMITELFEVLEQYEQDGLIRIVKGVVLPAVKDLNYDPNEELENVGRLLAANECLYDNKHTAKYIIFSDLDELLLPKNGDYFDEFTRIRSLHLKVSSFEFNWGISAAPAQSANSYDVTRPLKDVMVREVVGFGTPVVIPQKVDAAFEHSPMNAMSSPRHLRLSRTDSWSIKFIFPVYNAALKNLTIPLNFSPRIGFYFSIMDEFNQRLNQNRGLYNKFKSLPSQLSFGPKIEPCLRIQKLRSVPYTCINQRNCLPAIANTSRRCTVLKRTFHVSSFGAGRYLYSSLRTEFSRHHSCVVY